MWEIQAGYVGNVGILWGIQQCYRNAGMSSGRHAYYGMRVCGRGVCSVMGDVVLLCGFWHVFGEATIVWGFHTYDCCQGY